MFDLSPADQARIRTTHDQASDEVRRDALREYHAAFAGRIVKLLADDVPSGLVEAHRDRAVAPSGFDDLEALSNALARLVAGVGPVLDGRLRAAQELRNGIEGPHIAIARTRYETWRTETLAILGERDPSWVKRFSAPRTLQLPEHQLAFVDDLREWLDEDVALLQEFASETAQS